MLMWPFGNAGGLASYISNLICAFWHQLLPTGNLRGFCRPMEEWAALSSCAKRWCLLGKLWWGLELCSKGRVLQICSGLGMRNDAFLAEPLNTYDKMCNNTRQLYALSLKADKVAGHVLQIEVWKLLLIHLRSKEYYLYIPHASNSLLLSRVICKVDLFVTYSDQ